MADSELLNKALQAIVSRLEQTEKFVLEQAPDVVQQVVLEFKLQNMAQLLIGATLLVFGVIAIPVAWHQSVWWTGNYQHDPTGWAVLFMVGIVATVISVPVLLTAIYARIYVMKCTKLFLLREFRKHL